MSESGGGEKKVGIFGGLIAAIGMLFARTADDCARVGAKGASLTARESAHLVEDGARLASRGAQFSDDAVRGGSKLGALADDAVKGAPHGSLPHFSEGALEAAARSEKSFLGLSDDVAEQALDVSLDVVSNLDFDTYDTQFDDNGVSSPREVRRYVQSMARDGAERARKNQFVSGSRALALLPADEDGFASMFGYAAPEGTLQSMQLVADLLEQPRDARMDVRGFAKWLVSNRGGNPLVILGYTALDSITDLVMPSGQHFADKVFHQGCLQAGVNCIVIACDSKEISEGESCIRSAHILWAKRAEEPGKQRVESFAGRLLRDREKMRHGEAMIVSRVVFDKYGHPAIVRSRVKPKQPPPKP